MFQMFWKVEICVLFLNSNDLKRAASEIEAKILRLRADANGLKVDFQWF